MSKESDVEEWLKRAKLMRFASHFKESGFEIEDIELLDDDDAIDSFVSTNLKVTNLFNARKIKKKLTELREEWLKKKKRTREDSRKEESEGEEAVGERPRKRLKVENVCNSAISSKFNLFSLFLSEHVH